jgi:TRAP-type mannitol/chloroaromatic compound transport system permease small subunit
MNALLKLARLVDRVTDVAGWVASTLVLAATLTCVANALLRYGANFGSNAWLEAQIYMFGAMMYLGGAQTLRMNEHIRIDVLYSGRSERARLRIDIFGLLLFLLPVTVAMTWLSWRFFGVSYAGGEMSANPGGLPVWPIKLLIPVGFALLTLQGLSELVKRIAALKGLAQVDVAYEKPQQ